VAGGGLAVEVAAGVLAHAGPGEVLVSSTVKDLVPGSGIAFETQGAYPRDGSSGPDAGAWHLFRVERGERDRSAGGAAAPLAPGAVSAGRRVGRLTAREREVAAHLARGLSNRQIAGELVIAVATAERHVTNVLNKLGFHSRAQIAAWAAEQGLHRTRFG
jgi:DNA-binding CsgD family transcriptional regulator